MSIELTRSLSQSSYVRRMLEEAASDHYREAMDYFSDPAIEPNPAPATAVEAAAMRAANIQAGHVYGLTKKFV